MPQLTRFPGKRAFITGAGSGLGRELCHQLAERGWTLGVQDVNPDTAQQTLREVERLGGRGETYVFDVSDGEAFAAAGKAFVERHGGIDLAVNNAGVAVGGDIGEIPLEDWRWIIGVNLMGPVNGCHVFTPVMRRQKAGHIVNVASLAGLVGAPWMGPYCTAKFGVVGLSESLRAELAGSGVSVSVVCPAFFRTNIVSSMRATHANVHSLAGTLMERATSTPADVVPRILEAIQADRLYVLPHREARFAWLMKRFAPSFFNAVVSRGYKGGFHKRWFK